MAGSKKEKARRLRSIGEDPRLIALRRDVAANPADMGPREAMADWLIQNGCEDWGEFIHTHIAMRDLPRRFVVEGDSHLIPHGDRCWEVFEAYDKNGNRCDFNLKIGDRIDFLDSQVGTLDTNDHPTGCVHYGLKVIKYDKERTIVVWDENSLRDTTFEELRTRLRKLYGRRRPDWFAGGPVKPKYFGCDEIFRIDTTQMRWNSFGGGTGGMIVGGFVEELWMSWNAWDPRTHHHGLLDHHPIRRIHFVSPWDYLVPDRHRKDVRKEWPGIEFSWEVSGQESVSDLAPVLDEWMGDEDLEADWEWGDETEDREWNRRLLEDDDE